MDSQTRQEFVRAAVGFLQNPKLIDSSLQDKLKFLRDKGLSDIEVDEAINLAIVNRHQSQGGKWNFILVLGLCVGGYKLYQAYLESKKAQTDVNKNRETGPTPEPLLSKTSPLQNDHSKDNPTLDEIIQKIAELKKLIELQRTNFGQEVQSLKTLLLGHEKFAAPPVIPAWQLGDSETKEELPSEKEQTPKDNSKGGKKKGDKGKKTSNTDQARNGFNDPAGVIAPILE